MPSHLASPRFLFFFLTIFFLNIVLQVFKEFVSQSGDTLLVLCLRESYQEAVFTFIK